ncbi:MAG: hypothetical protein ACPG6P_05490 [Akkermansiaceae bacterium]
MIAWLASFPAACWAAYHERRITAMGEPLLDNQRSDAKHLGVERADDVYLCLVDEVPNPLLKIPWLSEALEKCLDVHVMSPAGITLGHGIYVTQVAYSKRLIRHELVHVNQYERSGSIRAFMVEYLYQCLMYGYYAAPWEEEARAGEL